MNLAELEKKLIAAARAEAPDDRVPYLFEKRITALLAGRTAGENTYLWVNGFWRAAISCVAITLLIGSWTMFTSAGNSTNSDDLPQNFESTLLASVDQSDQVQ